MQKNARMKKELEQLEKCPPPGSKCKEFWAAVLMNVGSSAVELTAGNLKRELLQIPNV